MSKKKKEFKEVLKRMEKANLITIDSDNNIILNKQKFEEFRKLTEEEQLQYLKPVN